MIERKGFLGNDNPTYTIYQRKNIQTVIKNKKKEIKTKFKRSICKEMKSLPTAY